MTASKVGIALRIAFSTSIGLGAIAAQADTIVYDAVPSPVPGNVPSLGPEAYSYKELGDMITLAAGPRALKKVDLLLSSWACETGEWNLGTCSTTPGATFTHPITLNIYGSDGVTILGSVTQTFTIPYRPSANALCSDPKTWSSDGGVTCFNGLAHLVTFDSAALSSITLPDTFVFGVAYNTRSHGYAPLGVSGPYDSLNVGLSDATNPSPSVGTDATGVDGLYWYTTYLPFYCDGGAGGSSFRLDAAAGCWAPYGGIDIRFVTAPPATPVNLTGFTRPVDPAPTLNMAKSGRTIPLKFDVATTDGVPVTDLASVDVTIAGVDCGTLDSDGTAPLGQVASGNSGLINRGNGYYQWNWKTTKGTRGCQIATLTLPAEYASEPASLTAYFKFKK